MEQRIPTIFEVVEQAERRQKKAQPEAGQRKLKPARKPSGKTSQQRPKPGRKTDRKRE